MSPRSLLRCLLLLGLIAGAPLRAAPEGAKSLVIRGRTVDSDGWPIERARVSLKGARSASAQTDEGGRFTLGVTIGSPSEMTRKPIELSVEARAKGDRLALGDGSRELRLVIRPLEGSAGARVEVLASQPEAATILARSLEQAGDAVAIFELVFTRVRGTASGPEHPQLIAHVVASLAGVQPGAAPAPPVSTPRPPAVANPKPARTSPAPPSSPALGRAADTTGAAARARERSAREQQAVRTKQQEEQAAREARESSFRARQAQADSTRRAWERIARERQAREQAASGTSKSLYGRPNPAGAAGAGPSTAAGRGNVPAGSPTRVDTARAGSSPPSSSPSSPGSSSPGTVSPSPPPVTTPANRPTESAPSPDKTVKPFGEATPSGSSGPAPTGATAEPRATAAPPATPSRAAPAPARSTPAADAAAEPCGCRIEGTIEVQSERALSHRVKLVVRLRDQPSCRDTVELFMGSPRVFELRGAACGTHVVEVELPGRERYRLSNPIGDRTLTCAKRSLRQLRLILLPR